MRINSINNFLYNNSFGTSRRVIKDKETGQTVHRNHTDFYRDDLDWKKFTDYIARKYEVADKVNMYNYACSDGSEPYTMAMILICKLGDKADKYFPIIAKDFDPYIIDRAKDGSIIITDNDERIININTNRNLPKFFTVRDHIPVAVMRAGGNPNAKANNILKNNVRFEHADITEDYKSIKKNNSIVMCRNFWPYLKNNETRLKLAQDLYNQLGDSSLLVIGDFDNKNISTHDMLLKEGFIPVENLENVYQKNKESVF